MKAESPYSEELNWISSPICIIEVGEAREIMLGITDGDTGIWDDLLRREWGGHYHRVLLQLACSDSADDQLVNITPLYLEERMNDFDKDFDELDEWKQKLRMRSACNALSHEMEESKVYHQTIADSLYSGLADHRYDSVEEGELFFINKERELFTGVANCIAHLISTRTK